MTTSLRIAVLVSGRGSNLQALLDAQTQGVITSRVTRVISNKEGAYALERAKISGVACETIPSRGKDADVFYAEVLTALKKESPDLIVLAGFMKILPVSIIDSFPGRIINIHPSLLPAFPGLHAQQQAVTAGVKVAGCTVHFVDKGCDTGPIILQKTEPVRDDDTAATLAERLLAREHEVLVEAVRLIEQGRVAVVGRRVVIRSS